MTDRQSIRLQTYLYEQAVKITAHEAIQWMKDNKYPQPEKTYWHWRDQYVKGFQDIPLEQRIKDGADAPLPKAKSKKMNIRLTQETRLKIEQCYESGFTIREVAEQLDIPYATVGTVVTKSGLGRKRVKGASE